MEIKLEDLPLEKTCEKCKGHECFEPDGTPGDRYGIWTRGGYLCDACGARGKVLTEFGERVLDLVCSRLCGVGGTSIKYIPEDGD